MKQPIIGITGNEFNNKADDTGPLLSYVVTNFVHAIKRSGGLPLIIPMGSTETAKSYIAMIDKLVMTGGQRVLPQFYGDKKSIVSNDYKLERDCFELELIKEARVQNKPIFAVCRGMQLFNVAMGGTLHQDIPNHWQKIPADTGFHQIEIEKNSPLATIYGQKTTVNSFHHQAIKDLASHLQVIAQAPDQTIEAITTTDGSRFLGVQWHPELLIYKNSSDQSLFDFVVQKL
ncbi:gamma-glutamyl-gamma-aminobutyrate hydrolase family protein [Streptococcus sp. X16XC17]|uniref:gamma-glutamyl-gamma-aminobutyrate hydrolase family protein n=1 Tax=unclassified Streptococcus TaxID=2608887 RepID=UPI00066FF29E|nr:MULTISPECIES: gamma-glutamyl-gamma-aminobutyrate hydrolase family protein [unclassified Streptococcus]TCD46780.1 gamma-glutamyl-gamma-aminobutyrate hydrolase family protein [Streptococcus sp. X16XC17]